MGQRPRRRHLLILCRSLPCSSLLNLPEPLRAIARARPRPHKFSNHLHALAPRLATIHHDLPPLRPDLGRTAEYCAQHLLPRPAVALVHDALRLAGHVLRLHCYGVARAGDEPADNEFPNYPGVCVSHPGAGQVQDADVQLGWHRAGVCQFGVVCVGQAAGE